MPGGQAISNVDALAAAHVQPEDKVAMVGGFVPFIKTLKESVAQLWVIDCQAGTQAGRSGFLAFSRTDDRDDYSGRCGHHHRLGAG